MNWMLIWKIVFVGVLAVFAVMAVMTTIYGARDIKKMLRELDEEKDEED